ncbi:MAG: DUF1294 domain-containing protein [Oscillospiraceae bacterium]|nr:DUF1294 domain-containing protein [Oscillospiraceae bacterium]
MKILLTVYIIANVISFAAFGIDKWKARKDRWRIPERTLLLLGLFGGIGQLAGMKVFRHKTHKWYFNLTAYLFIIIQIGLFILLYTKGII